MELTEGQSISRTDLFPSPPSSSPPSPTKTSYVKKLAKEFGSFDYTVNPTVVPDSFKSVDNDTVAFRLFEHRCSRQSGNDATQRVLLRSPTPVSQEPGFVIAGRPDNYYFSGNTTKDQALEYQQAAVSSDDIIAGLKINWKGCELPWRVTVIQTPTSIKPSQTLVPQEGKITTNKTRKGKKTRIAVRKRLAAANIRKAQGVKLKEEKDATEKEKRNRKNRERKLKRRQKERDAKAEQKNAC